MSTAQLDRIVKGAPPPNVSPEQVASAARRSSSSLMGARSYSSSTPHSQPPPRSTPSQPPMANLSAATAMSDPLSNLPSSPGQVYLNLLILESSLRAQYLSLRARLRLYLVLMTALALWISTFTYLLFLRPREDGRGAGGSPYWVVDMAERLGWVGGVVTGGLVWGTGMWDRGVRWPRKWLGTTNRGLRGFNLKVVIIRGPWYREIFHHLAILDPLGWWGQVRGMRFEFMPKDIERNHTGKDTNALWEHTGRGTWIEEDIAPGGDMIKLLLLPKPFSPDFREDWDNYRTDYWNKENSRRAQLRAIVKGRNRQTAKQDGGWLWWTGWRGWKKLTARKRPDVEANTKVIREKGSNANFRPQRRRESVLRQQSNSRSSSRSTTPDPDMRHPRRSEERALRRGSSSHSSTQAVPRKKRPVPSAGTNSSTSNVPRPSALATASASDSRPPTPGSSTSETSTLRHKASSSNLGTSSVSDNDIKEETPPTDVEGAEIKKEDET